MIVRVNEFEAIKVALEAVYENDDDLPIETHFVVLKAMRAISEIESRYDSSVEKSRRNINEKRQEDPTYARSQKERENHMKNHSQTESEEAE